MHFKRPVQVNFLIKKNEAGYLIFLSWKTKTLFSSGSFRLSNINLQRKTKNLKKLHVLWLNATNHEFQPGFGGGQVHIWED